MKLNDAFQFFGLHEHSSEEDRFAAYQKMRTRLDDKLAKAPTEGLKQKYRAGLVQMDEAIEAVENRVDEKDLPPIGSNAGTVSAPSVQKSAPLPEPRGQVGPPAKANDIGALVRLTQQAGVLLGASTTLMFLWIATWFVDSLAEFKLVAGCSAAVLFLWGCYRLPSDESYGEDKEGVEALASSNKPLAFGKTVALLAVWGALVYGLGAHKWTGETVAGAYDTAKGWVSGSVVDPNTNSTSAEGPSPTGGTVAIATRSKDAAGTHPSRASAGANGSASTLYVVFRAGHERGFDDVAEADRDAFADAVLNDDRNFGERDTVWTYQSNVIEIPFHVSTQKAGADLGNINQAMANVHQASQVMESKDRDRIASWEWKVVRTKEADSFNIVRYFWTREAAEGWRNARQLQTFYPAAPPSL